MIATKLDILKSVLGDCRHENAEQLLFYCPNCEHHKPKLAVNIDKNAFKCWICFLKGNNLGFLIRKYGSRRDRDKWAELSGGADLSQYDQINFDVENKPREFTTVELPDGFNSLSNSSNNWYFKLAWKYLLNRGLTKEDVLFWKIGYVADGDLKGHIIIPSFDMKGSINYYVARTFLDRDFKYRNPPLNHNFIFNHLFVDWNKDVVLVEGVFDAIKAGQNAIPLLGSTLDEKSYLFEELVYHQSTVYIALDPDAEHKSKKLIEELRFAGLKVFQIKIDVDLDVGDMTEDEFLQKKKEAKLMTHDKQLLYRINEI